MNTDILDGQFVKEFKCFFSFRNKVITLTYLNDSTKYYTIIILYR